jgi:hypothetical protein
MITLYTMTVKKWGFPIPTLALLLVVGIMFMIVRKTKAEMFPSPPQWMDVSPPSYIEHGAHVHYFEYKGRWCFVGNTGEGRVVNLQCGNL